MSGKAADRNQHLKDGQKTRRQRKFSGQKRNKEIRGKAGESSVKLD